MTETSTSATTMQSAYLDACRGTNSGGLPVWVMRQAGRYLPEYRAVREKVSFLELCKSPDLIAEVTKQPIDRFGFDAAILFSDILPLLQPLGMNLDYPGGGPVIDPPLREPEDIARLKAYDVTEKLSFVFEGVRRIKQVMPDTPLIGFAGSPFTLACYAIEGKGSANFNQAKKFLFRFPKEATCLLELIANMTAEYLAQQIKAGAEAVQLFDSWGGILAPEEYQNWSAKYTRRIFDSLKQFGVPRILFVNNLAPYIDIVREIDCEVVSVDYRMKLSDAERSLPGKALQGNLDPTCLFGTPESVRERTMRMLDSVKDHSKLIVNLGHGILPKTPLESVAALVETVRSYRSYQE